MLKCVIQVKGEIDVIVQIDSISCFQKELMPESPQIRKFNFQSLPENLMTGKPCIFCP